MEFSIQVVGGPRGSVFVGCRSSGADTEVRPPAGFLVGPVGAGFGMGVQRWLGRRFAFPRRWFEGPAGAGFGGMPSGADTEVRPPATLLLLGVSVGWIERCALSSALRAPSPPRGRRTRCKPARGAETGSGQRSTARTEPRLPVVLVCGPGRRCFRRDAQRSGHGGPPPRHPLREASGRCGEEVGPVVARTEPRPPAALACGPGRRWFRKDAQRSGHGGPPPRRPVCGACGRCGAEVRPAVARTEPRPPVVRVC